MEMPYFFLSYARADNSELVQRFFDDLATTIRDGLSLPGNAPVGFFEEVAYSPASNWSEAASEALKTSLTMVCLLSPAYLRSERAGKEWQVFEDRRRRYLDSSSQGTLPQKLSDVIFPVSWISLPSPFPIIVSKLLAHPDGIYQNRSMMTMFRSSAMFKGEYSEFIRTLASRIIDVTSERQLLPLNSSPKMAEVRNAFQLWEEIVTASDESRSESTETKPNLPTVEVDRTEQVPEPVTSSAGEVGVSSSLPGQSASALLVQTQFKKYSVFGIGKSKEALEEIEQCCLFSEDFDWDACEDPERAMDRLDMRLRDGQDLPELIVIDLDMGSPAVEVIKELKNRTSAGILGLSSNFEGTTAHEVLPRRAILPKPFDSLNDAIAKMNHFAKLAREVGAFESTVARDPFRERTVFLSFCGQDKRRADELRRNLLAEKIDVAYSKDIQEGRIWMKDIEEWVAKAEIFVALISKDYLKSKYCRAELINFVRRVKSQKSEKLIPIYLDSPNVAGNKSINELVHDCQRLSMSTSDRIDISPKLVARIKSILGRY